MAGNENSGRPTNAEIIRKYVDTELANKIANKELKRIDEKERADIEELRTVVMPIALKGMVNKSETTVNVLKMDEDILDKYAPTPEPENNSQGQD